MLSKCNMYTLILSGRLVWGRYPVRAKGSLEGEVSRNFLIWYVTVSGRPALAGI